MMNYSDYDSDGYSSNEDADYLPSDDNLSEDDLNDCEKEDPLNEDDEVPHPGNSSKKKSKKKDISARKRKKGVLVVEKEEKKEGGESEEVKPLQEEEKTGKKEGNDEERQKKKSDDLWASFLSDVGTRPKTSTEAPQLTDTPKQTDASPSPSAPVRSTKAEPEKVVITKVFDFAGEQVKVEKEVSADSREAKSFLKSQSSSQEETVKQPDLPGPSVKRSAGMSSILGQIGGKKPKMSTLEKSKMDWDAFKTEEGIGDELAIHNRGREGYVERKNFLERVDHRQFELEKSVRLSNMKR